MTEPAQWPAGLDIAFSTASVHERDRLSFWRDEATKAYVPHEFNTGAGRAFEGSIRSGQLGVLGLAMIACDQCEVEHTSGCIKNAVDDDLLITVQLGGSALLRQDGRDEVISVNHLFLIDPRRPFAVDVGEGNATLVIKVPRAELQARLGDLSVLTARPVARTPEAVLAMRFLGMMTERAKLIGAPAADKIARQALDLIALAYEAEMPGLRALQSSTRATTLLRLKAVIEARLPDPYLKPHAAAAAAGISVRYANSLLAQEGTSLERFIVSRRLRHCRRMLEDPTQMQRPVSDIAFSWGFSDVSHFTRRFKAEFGCAPSEWRARAIEPLGRGADPTA